jgi:hypothetical protein
LHECRRTAVRNITGAYIPERIAMIVGEDKTCNVFDPYDLASEDDLRTPTRKA